MKKLIQLIMIISMVAIFVDISSNHLNDADKNQQDQSTLNQMHVVSLN